MDTRRTPTASDLRQEALNAARGLSAGDSALVEVLRELERERGRATEAAATVVRALSATLQARDGYTGDHADAVHDLSVAVGDRLGLDRAAMAELAAVALLHDVGKIGIPDHVLHKPGPLDDDEWVLMREHPVIGERILASVPGLDAVARAVRHEHERWDGQGYPDGLREVAIPLASRIVLACDAWHALVSDRPYRRGLARDAALAELRRCSGTQFDPGVITVLLEVLEDPAVVAGEEADRDRGALLASVGSSALERELVALIKVATAVAAAHGMDEVIEVAAEEALAAIGAASLSIERWIPERNILRTVINVGDLAPCEDRRPVEEICQLDGDAILAKVLEEGGTHYCSLDDPDIAPSERTLLVSLGKHSSVSVPILFGNAPWGQIWATRTADQEPFDERETRFLHAISGQVGAAIGRAEIFSRVTELAHTDGLTGLANRRAFDESLELAALEARRDGRDLALVLCDLDNLKDINDHHGHEAGDHALRTVADALEKSVGLRAGVTVCRVGGDEFALLLHADANVAREIAETVLRRSTSSHPPVGVSCGVATMRGGQGRTSDLLRAADAAQYAAKRAGRGRVYVAGPGGVVPGVVHGAASGSMRQRALRDADAGPAIDTGRLLTEALGLLDGPLAQAAPPERLAGLLRRIGEAVDAVGWTVAFAHEGAGPEAFAVGGRPGSPAGVARSSPWLAGPDILALRLSRPGTASGAGVVVTRDEPGISAVLRRRLEREHLEALLVLTITAPNGTWFAELGGDPRSGSLGAVEPVLRVLVPEALRAVNQSQRFAVVG